MKFQFKTIFILLLLSLFLLSGCSFIQGITNRNSPERIQRKQEKQFAKTYEKLKKRHLKQQSQRTLNMFERNEKREKKLNRIRRLDRRSWWERVLGIGDRTE